MHITITAPHMDITPALSEAVHEKVQRLAKHSERDLRIHVALTVENGRHKAEMTVHNEGEPFVASATEADMYTSINKAARTIDRQWRKRKTARMAARHKSVPLKRMALS